MKKFMTMAVVAMTIGMFAGCEGGGSSGGGDYTGTWQLTSNEGVIYLVLMSGGNLEFRGSPDAATSTTGTYSVDGNHITGPWTSPGMSGNIDATVTDGVMTLEFIETTPPKTVHYSGSKM